MTDHLSSYNREGNGTARGPKTFAVTVPC